MSWVISFVLSFFLGVPLNPLHNLGYLEKCPALGPPKTVILLLISTNYGCFLKNPFSSFTGVTVAMSLGIFSILA